MRVPGSILFLALLSLTACNDGLAPPAADIRVSEDVSPTVLQEAGIPACSTGNWWDSPANQWAQPQQSYAKRCFKGEFVTNIGRSPWLPNPCVPDYTSAEYFDTEGRVIARTHVSDGVFSFSAEAFDNNGAEVFSFRSSTLRHVIQEGEVLRTVRDSLDDGVELLAHFFFNVSKYPELAIDTDGFYDEPDSTSCEIKLRWTLDPQAVIPPPPIFVKNHECVYYVEAVSGDGSQTFTGRHTMNKDSGEPKTLSWDFVVTDKGQPIIHRKGRGDEIHLTEIWHRDQAGRLTYYSKDDWADDVLEFEEQHSYEQKGDKLIDTITHASPSETLASPRLYLVRTFQNGQLISQEGYRKAGYDNYDARNNPVLNGTWHDEPVWWYEAEYENGHLIHEEVYVTPKSFGSQPYEELVLEYDDRGNLTRRAYTRNNKDNWVYFGQGITKPYLELRDYFYGNTDQHYRYDSENREIFRTLIGPPEQSEQWYINQYHCEDSP